MPPTEGQPFLAPHDLLYVLIGVALVVITVGRRVLDRLNVSHTLLYLAIGVLAGPALLDLAPEDPLELTGALERVTELAVIMSLIVIGIRIGRPISWRGWGSAVRLILVVMPLTIAVVALGGMWLLGLALGPAILLGAVLAPTDPILAGALEEHDLDDEREDRFGLSSEAGLNDGFAFPFVYLGLYVTLAGAQWREWLGWWFAVDLLYGVVLALPLGFLGGRLIGRAYAWSVENDYVSQKRHEFVPLGLLLLAYGLVEALGAYGFLAAFTAGLGLRRALHDHDSLHDFASFTDAVDGLFKGAILLLVGALLRPAMFAEVGWSLLAFAALLLVVVRPLLTWLATTRGGWSPTERLYWSWFGIRGIGSLYYLSYALGEGVPRDVAEPLFTIVLGVVVLSGVVHSTSLRPFMNAFEGGEDVEE